MYAFYHLEPKRYIGPVRTFDQALILAESAGPGDYELFMAGDVPRHICFVTCHADGTFTLDPRQAGNLNAVLSDTLTRA